MRAPLVLLLLASVQTQAASFCSSKWVSQRGATILGPVVSGPSDRNTPSAFHDPYLVAEPNSPESLAPGTAQFLRELASAADFVRSRNDDLLDFFEVTQQNIVDYLSGTPDQKSRLILTQTLHRLKSAASKWTQQTEPEARAEALYAYQGLLWDSIVALHLEGKKTLVGASIRQIFGRGEDTKVHVAVQKDDGKWILIEVKNWPAKWYEDGRHLARAVSQSTHLDQLRKRGFEFEHWLVMTSDLPEVRDRLVNMGARFDWTWVMSR